MRLVVLTLVVTLIHIYAFGQSLVGEYRTYYGNHLELRADSTFEYTWTFDLTGRWAIGTWSLHNRIITLHFTEVYDTLTRPDRADSLLLSVNKKSERIDNEEFLSGLLTSGGQGHANITNQLAIRRQRLYLIDENGEVLRKRESGILNKRQKPTYYQKVE